MKNVYPNGIHGCLGELLREVNKITVITVDNVMDITKELLVDTDVMLWLGWSNDSERI